MKASKLNDMTAVLGLEPKRISEIFPEGAVDAVDSLTKTRAELKKANEEYENWNEKYKDAVKAALESSQKEMELVKAALPEESPERKESMALIVKSANASVDAIKSSLGYEAAQDREVTVVVQSNDRFDLMVKAFNKVACERYVSAEALSETSQALKAAIEA